MGEPVKGPVGASSGTEHISPDQKNPFWLCVLGALAARDTLITAAPSG